MTLLVRDEEDILETNLIYHLDRGVDFIVATDNLSTDGSREILERYAKEGYVRVLEEEKDTYDQATWVTRMARMAAEEYSADWVINDDVDEFWWPEEDSLKGFLQDVPAGADILVVPRVEFRPTKEESLPFYERMIYRDTGFETYLGGPLAPKVCHRGTTHIWVGIGNHSAGGPGLKTICVSKGLVVMHFPIRSFAQLERKIVNGGKACSNIRFLPQEFIRSTVLWKVYELHQRGELRQFFEKKLVHASNAQQLVDTGEVCIDDRLRYFVRASSRTAGDYF